MKYITYVIIHIIYIIYYSIFFHKEALLFDLTIPTLNYKPESKEKYMHFQYVSHIKLSELMWFEIWKQLPKWKIREK